MNSDIYILLRVYIKTDGKRIIYNISDDVQGV